MTTSPAVAVAAEVPNPIKTAIREHRRARGLGLSMACPELIEVLAPLGLDFVLIDGEHGAFDRPVIEALCRAAEAAGIMPIARVPDLRTATIGGFLDRGVRGILGPHVGTAEDARQLVRACRFPPAGERSFGAARGDRHGRIDDFGAHCQAANAGIVVSALLEDRRALANLDRILEVDGIDYYSVGQFDLALSLDRPPEHAEVEAAIADVATRVRAAGRLMREDCMDFVWDRELIEAGAQATLFPR